MGQLRRGARPVVDVLMVALARWSEVAFIALVVVWLLGGLITGAADRRQAAVAAPLGSGLALAVNQVISLAWSRPRPFAAHPGQVHVLLSHPADASFPSDHVAAAVAIAIVVLSVRWRLGLLTLLIALAVGYARIFVGDHYPGDVVGGAVVGLLAGVVLTTTPARSVIAEVDRRVARGAGRWLQRPA